MAGLLFCRRFARTLVLVIVSAAAPAQARTFAGVTMPDHMVMDGITLRLNGMGLRTFTFLQVHGYVAGLYVARAARTLETILATPGIKLVRIQYVHAASLDRVQNEIRHGRAVNCAAGCPKSDDPAFAQLVDTARAVQPGDTSTYIYGPEGVQVLFNDKVLATILNPDFARRMLGSMLGEHPPTAALRDGMLGAPAS